MKNSSFPAFPVENYKELASDIKENFVVNGGFNPTGLTKREYFAGLAMQALLSSEKFNDTRFSLSDNVQRRRENYNDDIVYHSIKLADELLIINISDYTCWYKLNYGKDYLMNEREDCFYLEVKGVEFKVKKKDVEIIPYVEPS
jgi:hypothetical protein